MPKPIGVFALELLHLCVLDGISAEYLSHGCGQTLGRIPKTMVETAVPNTQMGVMWASVSDLGMASPQRGLALILRFAQSPLSPPGLRVWDRAHRARRTLFCGQLRTRQSQEKGDLPFSAQRRPYDATSQPLVAVRLLRAGLRHFLYSSWSLPAVVLQMRLEGEAGTPVWGGEPTFSKPS